MGRVIHFEIVAKDPKRAGRFYQEAFGWEVSTWGGPETYWLLKTGAAGTPGIDGAVMGSDVGGKYNQPVINTILIDSMKEALERIEKAGGKKVHGPNEIPGIGSHAYCSDPEGNLFGILVPVMKS